MKAKLLLVFFLFAMLARAEWGYQQYAGDAMVSFYQEPAASAEMLKQAKAALETLDGVKSVYVKDNSVFVVKEPARSWRQLWEPIVLTLSHIKPEAERTPPVEESARGRHAEF